MAAGGVLVRKLIATSVVSLDGVMLGPDRDASASRGGFSSTGWPDPSGTQAIRRTIAARGGNCDALLFGRRTYERLVATPTRLVVDENAGALARLEILVASHRSGAQLAWPRATILGGEARDCVTALKRGPGGDILLVGSATLARSLRDHDLIDEHVLLIHPVIVSRGRRLLDDGDVLRGMSLVDTVVADGREIVATYARRPGSGARRGGAPAGDKLGGLTRVAPSLI